MAKRVPRLATQGGRWKGYRERRFSILLVILLLLLIASPFLMDIGPIAVWFDGLMALLLLAAIHSLCFERRQRLFALLFGIPTVFVVLGSHAWTGPFHHRALFLGHFCGTLFLLGAACIVVRTLFENRPPTLDSICGAVAGYLFLGLAWSLSYSLIETVQPGSFRHILLPHGSLEDQQYYELIYYSFVTLTTLGYGDVAPLTPVTRTLAWIEAVSGQFYMAIIVAGIVSAFVTKITPRENEESKSVRGE